MEIAEIIGYLAATIGTLVMFPQLIKSLKTKKVEDISSLSLAFYFMNCILWGAYGIMIIAWPVIVCNSIAIMIVIAQITIKIRYN